MGFTELCIRRPVFATVLSLVLLLAGLMLADKVATLEERAEKAERHLNRLQANPTRVEVPVIPSDLKEAMAELAARAESLADRLEEQRGR